MCNWKISNVLLQQFSCLLPVASRLKSTRLGLVFACDLLCCFVNIDNVSAIVNALLST